jgi:hypothetical protein
MERATPSCRVAFDALRDEGCSEAQIAGALVRTDRYFEAELGWTDLTATVSG